MSQVELEQFIKNNPGIFSSATEDDLEQLRRIYELYPDSVRLLSDAMAVEVREFECQRCGACCTTVRFIPVSHADALRWTAEKRWDIFERLVVDRRRTPLMAIWGKDSIQRARAKAAAVLEGCEMDEHKRNSIAQILYITDLVESAVYTAREDNRCTFFSTVNNHCIIHDTKPHVCEKFPYYMGKFMDPRLLEMDFCPALKEFTKKN